MYLREAAEHSDEPFPFYFENDHQYKSTCFIALRPLYLLPEVSALLSEISFGDRCESSEI